uniref:Uncharacterized protein n=1 Tax=Caenorhabditis japonica TaxID=281687 RepID=A0A8R1DS51_CAEJA
TDRSILRVFAEFLAYFAGFRE